MALRAVKASDDPIGYFEQADGAEPRMRLADVVLRVNKNPREVFSRIIRTATQSPWSHSSLVYLVSDSEQGFDNNFVVEAMTSGVRVNSWRNELTPLKQYSAGIKQLNLDWYAETPEEQACHSSCDPEDMRGIGYLRQVRGIALDQINGLYDHAAVHELTGLYAERLAKRYMSKVPGVADALGKLVKRLESKDETTVPEPVLRFICSGLVQYSFVEALRRRIARGMARPDGRDAAMSNLANMRRVLFRDDADGLVAAYVREVQSGRQDIAQPLPGPVLNLLKTATPADFSASPNLAWRYVVLDGELWQIEPAEEGYLLRGEEEIGVLGLIEPKAQVVAEEAGVAN